MVNDDKSDTEKAIDRVETYDGPRETVAVLPHLDFRFIVTLTAFDLIHDNGKKYIPGDQIGEFYKIAILKEAAHTVRERLEIVVKDGGRYRIIAITSETEQAQPRAKIEVRVRYQGHENAMIGVNQAQARFLFQLRDDIIELIEFYKPPKRAWVADSKGARDQEKGTTNVNRTGSTERRPGSRRSKSGGGKSAKHGRRRVRPA